MREIHALVGLYIFSGVWLLAFALALFGLMSGHTGYTPGGAAGAFSGLVGIFLIAVLCVSIQFFLTAFSIRKRDASARTRGLVLSGLVFAFTAMAANVLPGAIIGVVRYSLDHPNLPSYLGAGFALSFPALLVVNISCLYYLTQPEVKAYLTR